MVRVSVRFRVITKRLSEIKEIYLSIRVRVRIMITRLPESEDGKIYLGGVGDCNE